MKSHLNFFWMYQKFALPLLTATIVFVTMDAADADAAVSAITATNTKRNVQPSSIHDKQTSMYGQR